MIDPYDADEYLLGAIEAKKDKISENLTLITLLTYHRLLTISDENMEVLGAWKNYLTQKLPLTCPFRCMEMVKTLEKLGFVSRGDIVRLDKGGRSPRAIKVHLFKRKEIDRRDREILLAARVMVHRTQRARFNALKSYKALLERSNSDRIVNWDILRDIFPHDSISRINTRLIYLEKYKMISHQGRGLYHVTICREADLHSD